MNVLLAWLLILGITVVLAMFAFAVWLALNRIADWHEAGW